MSLKKRYSCIFIPSDKSKKPLYFELTLIDKDLNNIVSQINKEFNLNFKINNSNIDENYGILLKDNSLNENSNIIYICHSANLDTFVKNNQNLTDAHTCYKVFDKFIFKKISLSEKGFAFCPEITTKLSNKNILIKEIPIRYKGRNFTEGKKIKFSDGLDALFTIIKYKLIK